MGFWSSLEESIRAHVDERVRSPFAGAFVVAWFGVNWKAVLILLFSERTIEARIDDVAANHFTISSTVWMPVVLAVVIAIGFYFASAIFMSFAEMYSSVESYIQRKFDRITWVAPTAYIKFKQDQGERISKLQELASDNLRLVEEEREKTQSVSNDLIGVQKNLNKTSSELAAKNEEIISLQRRIDANINSLMELRKSNEALIQSQETIDVAVEAIIMRLDFMLEKSKSDQGGDFLYVDKEKIAIMKHDLSLARANSKGFLVASAYVHSQKGSQRDEQRGESQPAM